MDWKAEVRQMSSGKVLQLILITGDDTANKPKRVEEPSPELTRTQMGLFRAEA